MNKIKLRIAFDPTETWNYLDFRQLIRNMNLNNMDLDNQIDVYLVTTNTDTEYINDVTTESGTDATRVFQESGNAAVVARLQAENINIYLTGSQPLVDLVNLTNPLTLVENQPVSGCQAITVISILDTYKLQNKYVTYLQFWIKQILKYEG